MNCVSDELLIEWQKLDISTPKGFDFYLQNIYPLVLERLRAESKTTLIRLGKVETLISMMGYSPETTLLATELLMPKKVFIVISEEVKDCFNIAFKYLTKNVGFEPFNIDKIIVNPSDTGDIYNKVVGNLKESSVVLDLTGGKKVMGAIAAQLAFQYTKKCIYIDGSKYSKEMRRPIPGTEAIIITEDPMEHQAHEKREMACDAFINKDYEKARVLFKESENLNTSDRRFDELGLAVTEIFGHWQSLRSEELARAISDLKGSLGSLRMQAFRREPDKNKFFEALSNCLAIFDSVSNREASALAFTFLMNSQIYKESWQYDLSCLYTYRSMELLVENALKKYMTDKFSMDKPIYFGDENEILKKYNEICVKFKHKPISVLPNELTLVSGYAILLIVSDYLEKKSETLFKAMGHLFEFASFRNKSIVAHGSKAVTKEQCQNFYQFTIDFFEYVHPEKDIKSMIKTISELPLKKTFLGKGD